MADDDIAWPAGWLRGVLDVTILAVVAQGETHGYAITRELLDRGFGRVTGGGLYPVLGRLEDGGFVEARWVEGDGGPGRKLYSITEIGRARLAEHRQAWPEFSAAVSDLLGP